MKTLQDYKQEAREEFNLLVAQFEHKFTGCSSCKEGEEGCVCEARDFVDEKAFGFLEETLDRLVDEIEKAVVPEARLYTQPKSELDDVEITEKEAFNRCRAQVKEAFTRFKGESV